MPCGMGYSSPLCPHLDGNGLLADFLERRHDGVGLDGKLALLVGIVNVDRRHEGGFTVAGGQTQFAVILQFEEDAVEDLQRVLAGQHAAQGQQAVAQSCARYCKFHISVGF